jgi:hypothetical protein
MASREAKVRVRRWDLERALEDNAQSKRSFLDVETGEVVPVYVDMVERGADQAAKRIASGVNTRYFLIPSIPSRESYQEMVKFIETVRDPKLAVELRQSIEGEGAFRKFRDVLMRQHRVEADRWMAEKTERTTRRIDEWLAATRLSERVELY